MSLRTTIPALVTLLAGIVCVFASRSARAGDGHAQPAASASSSVEAPPPDPTTEEARKHFRTGVKLYNDGNYDGARAEFEAAYGLKPGPSSLQNIALCLKARFKYVEALDTLEHLLEAHGSALSDAEKQAVQTAIDELNGVIGTIAVDVSPADATVSFDGTPLTPAQRAAIRASVGEHALDAKAKGFEPIHKVLRVVGGQKARIPLVLKPSGGFLDIVADDPAAAIAVDGKGLALARWKGPVGPGRHIVQVYREGYEPFEDVVWLEIGESKHIDGILGPKDDGAEPTAPTKPGALPAPPARQQRGFYALGVLSAVGLDEAPQDLNIDQAKNTAGGTIGVRAGYRLWTPIGAEFVLEGGQHSVTGACDAPDPNLPECPLENTRSYRLNSLRLGGAVRLMSSGARVRFTSALGVGAVRHKLTLDPNADKTKPGGHAEGFDPFFMAELGAQYNAGHVLFELDLVAFLDGANSLTGNLDKSGEAKVFGNSPGALPMLGAGLRVGWGEWKP